MIYDLRSDDNLYIYNKNIEKSSDLLTGEIKYDDVSESEMYKDDENYLQVSKKSR